MNCPKCNAELQEGATSCSYCGQIISNQPHTSTDQGQSAAKLANTFGILSFFLGPLFAILAFVMASKYKKVGNGANNKTAKIGQTCGMASIIIQALIAVVFGVMTVSAMKANGINPLLPIKQTETQSENEQDVSFVYDNSNDDSSLDFSKFKENFSDNDTNNEVTVINSNTTQPANDENEDAYVIQDANGNIIYK